MPYSNPPPPQIPATIANVTGLKAELAEIDENLIRNDLHFTERGDLLLKRKTIYEELHPETRQGGDRGNQYTGGKVRNPQSATPTFTGDTAGKAGISTRVIHEDLQVAKSLAPEVKRVVREHDIPKTDALKLARMEPEKQKAVVEKIAAGEAKVLKL